MSGKKVVLALGLMVVIVAFLVLSFGTVEATKKLPRPSHPPECFPLSFAVEGYWGMYCIDSDSDIVSAELKTSSSQSTLNWDNTYAEMIVKTDDDTVIFWSVCDFARNCVGSNFK